MSSRFGFRNIYHSRSDSVTAQSSDIRDEEAVPTRLFNRRGRFQNRDITNLRIDTQPKPAPLLIHRVNSPKSPASPGSPGSRSSPGSPGSPGSPDSPDTPTIPVIAVGSSPGLAQGSTLGAAEGPPSPASPASPTSPSGAESTTSTFPPATTSLTTSQTTQSVSTLSSLPSSVFTTSTVSTSTAALATTASSSTSVALTLATKTTLLSSSKERVGVSTTLAPLVPASTKLTSTSSSIFSSSSSTTTTSVKSADSVVLDTTIAAPVATSSPTKALSAVSPTDDTTSAVPYGINSESGKVGVYIVFPVVFSVGVIVAFLVIWWLKRRRHSATPTEDQSELSNGAAPLGRQILQDPGQRQSLRFRSDGSVMADLMDAAYAAENGGLYRQSQLSTIQKSNALLNEKVASINPASYTNMVAAPTLALPSSKNPVLSWLGGLRSGAPTVRGSVSLPWSEASSTDRTTVTGWPQGFEPADSKDNRLPANTRFMSYWSESSQGMRPIVASPPSIPALPSKLFEPRATASPPPPIQRGVTVRPLEIPLSPTQTAITYATTAKTESSWNTWGVEQHPRR